MFYSIYKEWLAHLSTLEESFNKMGYFEFEVYFSLYCCYFLDLKMPLILMWTWKIWLDNVRNVQASLSLLISWKDNDIFSGQGWLSILEGFDGLMVAKNVRASLSSLHAEMEALLWAMECIRNLRQFHVTFVTDCSQLVKMVSEQKNCQPLQVIWKILRSWKKVSSDQRSSMYQGREIQRLIV